MKWRGIMPAVTTPFKEDLSIDYEAMTKHALWLVENGSSGIVTPGSLGEGSSLTTEEKVKIWEALVKGLGRRAPVVAAISAMTPSDAIELAALAEKAGCQGLMVLPPYVYRGDWPETREYFRQVLRSTSLTAMLYNNPQAYGTDILPQHFEELAQQHENLLAVKESSGDVRRITAIRRLVKDRLQVFVGLDDAVVEGVMAGAVGWVSGISGVLPEACGDLFYSVLGGNSAKVEKLYHILLPLLRMDTVPKFVQLIKLMQEELSVLPSRVRMPRLKLSEGEAEAAKAVIHHAVKELIDGGYYAI